MASEAQILKFISEVAPCAQYAYGVVGKVYPSICIGMACVESAYGTAGSTKHHSYLGQKVGSGKTATKYWDGKFFSSKTKEEYSVGVHTTITSAFRAYDSLQQCVLNYYELLNTKLYSRVQAGVPYQLQMQQIKTCGYMTSSTEVNSVLRLINKYNLTQYDKASTVPGSPVQIAPKPEANAQLYSIGETYTTQVNLKIRDLPGGRALAMFELTDNAKKYAYTEGDKSDAILKKGTRVTCKALSNKEGTVWMKIPSGWICAKTAEGKIYIK